MKKITILVTMLFSLISNASAFKSCKSFNKDGLNSKVFNSSKLVVDEELSRSSGDLSNCPRQVIHEGVGFKRIYTLSSFTSASCTYNSLDVNSAGTNSREPKHISCVR